MSGAGAPRAAGDRVKQLRAFCHSARLGNFTRAADFLVSNQTSVSQQVRALEREFAVMLFERSGSNIRLTEIGRELFRIALPVVMDVDRLHETFEERYRRTSSGRLAIATSNTCAVKLVAGYLKRFREEHADTRVTVTIVGGTERVALLRDFEVELAVGAMDIVPPDLEFRLLFTSRIVLIAPAGHALAGRTAPDLAEIASFPMIAHPPGHYTRTLLEGTARHHGVVLNIVKELRGWDLIKRHVEMGFGTAAVPEFALEESDRLERIALDGGVPTRRYGVYMRREGTLSLPAQRFLALVEPVLSASPSSGRTPA